jgi:hypothetical protein
MATFAKDTVAVGTDGGRGSAAGHVGSTGCHDLGGRMDEEDQEISLEDKALTYWEKSVHALLILLASRKPERLLSTDELRRSVESLEPESYKAWTYYERWIVAITKIMLERHVISQTELDEELGISATQMHTPCLNVGDVVQVKKETDDVGAGSIRWRKPHLRCPGYICGAVGRVESYSGMFDDPAMLAFRGVRIAAPLYRVSFRMEDIWGSRSDQSPATAEDRVVLDIYQPWLVRLHSSSADGDLQHRQEHEHSHHHHDSDSHDEDCCGNHDSHDHNAHLSQEKTSDGRSHEHSHEHEHEHGHDHGHVGAHSSRHEVEAHAVDVEGVESHSAGKIVGDALFRLLIKKEVVTAARIAQVIESLDSAKQNFLGADLVVQAWLDSDFKARLLADGTLDNVSISSMSQTVLLFVMSVNSCVCWSRAGH